MYENDTIGTVKENIKLLTDIPINKQLLTFRHIHLSDERGTQLLGDTSTLEHFHVPQELNLQLQPFITTSTDIQKYIK